MTSPEETPEESPHHQLAAGRRKGTPSRPWLVVSESGQACFEEVEKHSIMRRTGIPAQDLRLLDPLLSYPSTILGRERAIVLNLEHVKAIITATEVLIPNSEDPIVAPLVHDLRSRLSNPSGAPHQTLSLEQQAYPALDGLTSKISTLNLEHVRHIKSRLVAISWRVQTIRDELEHLLDDDSDMAKMYLTKKLSHQHNGESSSRVEVDNDAFQLEVDS